MAVAVTPTTSAAVTSYANGTTVDIDHGNLWVYSAPDQPVAAWAAGTWQNAVIS